MVRGILLVVEGNSSLVLTRELTGGDVSGGNGRLLKGLEVDEMTMVVVVVVLGFSDNRFGIPLVAVVGSSEYRFLNLDSVRDIRGWTLVSFEGLLPDIKFSSSPNNWDSWGGGFEVDLKLYVLGGAVFTTVSVGFPSGFGAVFTTVSVGLPSGFGAVFTTVSVGFPSGFGLEDFVPSLGVLGGGAASSS